MDVIEHGILWVTFLPAIGTPIMNQRQAVLALLKQSEELNKLARIRREEAAHAAQELEAKIHEGGNWTAAEIDGAKGLASVGEAV